MMKYFNTAGPVVPKDHDLLDPLSRIELAEILLLHAFLQRVINGRGLIECKYGLGRGRTDRYVVWPLPHGEQRIVLELKLRHGDRQTTITKALPQITTDMDRCNADEGHLVLFDQSDAPWDQKIFRDQTQFAGWDIWVWGM